MFADREDFDKTLKAVRKLGLIKNGLRMKAGDTERLRVLVKRDCNLELHVVQFTFICDACGGGYYATDNKQGKECHCESKEAAS